MRVERVENLFGRQEVEALYKHILIPTDGSELSNKAIHHGIALAKAVNAKVTGITVTTPFHVIAIDPETLTDTADSYKKRTTALTTKYLTQVNDAAAAAGVSCAVIHVEHEHPYRAIIDAASRRSAWRQSSCPPCRLAPDVDR